MTSATSLIAYAGAPFTYQITATSTPNGFSAAGLPAGLTLNPLTGMISGTLGANAAGIKVATLRASNASGTGVDVPLTIVTLSGGQPNAKALAYISTGRTIFRRANPDLIAALSQFSAAVSADPLNPRVRVVRAFARIAALTQYPGVKTLLDRFGFSAEGRDLWNWTSMCTDEMAPDLSSKEVLDQLAGPVADALSQADLDLALVTGSDFLTVFAEADWHFGEDFFVDYGDVIMVRAFLKAAVSAIQLLTSQNADVGIANLNAAIEEGRVSVDGLLKAYPSLLKVQDAARARSAVGLFQSGVALYTEGLASINARPLNNGLHYLLEVDAEGRRDAVALQGTLQEAARSLKDSVVVHLKDPGNPNPGNQLHANAALIAAKFTTGWRAALPAFRPGSNDAEPRLAQGVFADPQLGGMTPELIKDDWMGVLGELAEYLDGWFAKRLKRLPQIVAAGAETTFLVKEDGSLWAWGDNSRGRLGEPKVTLGSKALPVRIGTANDWRSVVASNHTLGLKRDGTLFAWGPNGAGQLGDGTQTGRSAPVQIGETAEWKTVSVGAYYSAGIKKNGTLWLWGAGVRNFIAGTSNAAGMVCVGSDTDWESVAAGPSCDLTLALKKDGKLYLFSDGKPALIPSPLGTSGWSTISQGWSSRHWLGIANDGSLWASGANDYGQLGSWSYWDATLRQWLTAYNGTVRVGTDKDWLGVMVGGDHSLAIKRDGSAWVWGRGGGRLTQSYLYPTPEKVKTLEWVAGSVSENHAAGVRRDGSVWTSGGNGSGQLGDGTASDTEELQSVASVYGPAPAVQFLSQPMSADLMPGQALMLSVKASGSGVLTYQWRKNGVAIPGATKPSYVNTSALVGDTADYDVLVYDGSGNLFLSDVATVRQNSVPAITQQPQSQSITAGGSASFSVVATGAGTLSYQWRKDGKAISGANAPTYITTGSYNATYAVVVSNAAGSVMSNTAALTVDGISLGDVYVKNLGYEGSEIFRVGYLAGAGDSVTLAVDVSGSSFSSYRWLRSSGGAVSDVGVTSQPVLNIGSMQVSDAGTYSVVAMSSGGTIQSARNLSLYVNGAVSNTLPTSTSPTIIAGDHSTWLLKADGSLWAWGWNAYGQLGDGTQQDRYQPVQISPSGTWRSISARGTHVLAIKPNGTLWSWGRNDHGQLGNGTTADGATPIQVGSSSDWVSAKSRGAWSVALKADGTLWTWGASAFGQLGKGGTLDVSVPTQVGTAKDWVLVEPGVNHVFAKKADGTWYSWGRNDFGQLGDGSTVNRSVPGRLSAKFSTNVRRIVVGDTFTLEQKTDGSLWAVGDNRAGQFSNGTYVSSSLWTPAGMWFGETDGSNFVSNISTLGATVMAVSPWGSLYAWGSNAHQQIYDGGDIFTNSPIGMFYPSGSTGSALVSISVGVNHTAAMDADGNISLWGSNNHGQLGDGTNVSRDHATNRVSSLRSTLTPQSISFPAPGYKMQSGASFQLQATASSGSAPSGLSVGYRVISGSSVLSVSSSGLVTLRAGTYGTAVIGAFQSGDATHAPAPEVTRTITVLKSGAVMPASLSTNGAARMNAGRIAFLNRDLNASIAAFNSVMSSDPNNAQASVLCALARAFSLVQGSSTQKLLDRAGISPGGRNLWDWHAEPTNNFADGFNTSEFFDFLGGTAVAILNDIGIDLSAADSNFLMDIPDADWQLGRDYVMDYADTLLLRAFAKGAIASLLMGTTPNFDLDVNGSLQSSINTLQGLLAANPKLLTAKNAKRPQAAVAALQEGVAVYESALAAVALRSGNPDGEARIFEYGPNDLEDPTDVLNSFTTVLAAYDRGVALAENKAGALVAVDTAAPESIDETATRVNAKSLVDELIAGLRRNLPTYSGNYPAQGTTTGLIGNPRMNGAVVSSDLSSASWGDFFETAGGYLTKFFASRSKLKTRFGFTEGFDGALALPVGKPLRLQALANQAADSRGIGITYQWFKDGLPLEAPVDALDGAGVSYVVASAGKADQGDYALRATDVFGHEAWTGPIRVSVVSGVTTSAPTNVLKPGESADLSVSGAGGGTFQWRRNGVDIPNATSASYTVLSVQPSDVYAVVVTGIESGVSTTYPIYLNVNKPVAFTAQPVSVGVAEDESATFSVSVTGTEPFSYQWSKDGVNLAGETSASYTIAKSKTAHVGTYTVTVTNPVGRFTSAGAALSVAMPAVIKTAPQNVVANPGANATFSVEVSGTAPLTYKWRNASTDTPILGATSSTLILKNISAADAGSYSVEVTDARKSVVTATAALSVNSPVVVTAQPVGGAFNLDAPVNLNVQASGTAPLKYQWRKNGVAIAGGTAAAFSVSAGTESTSGVYDVQITNPVGTVTSGSAVVVMNIPATLVKQPLSVSAHEGGTVVLAAGAKGSGPLAYQWSKDGAILSGATSARLTLSNISRDSAGSYLVTVRNAFGSVTSTAALLSVVYTSGVPIVKQPVDMTLIKGSNVFESVAVAPADATVDSTQCQLYTSDSFGNAMLPVGGAVLVPSNGELRMPLRSVVGEGDYLLRFVRRLTNGEQLSSDSQPFRLTVRTWDDAVGSYAGLVQDVNGVVGDGAVYRGLLTVTMTRRGSLSGRLQYVEAQVVKNAESLGYRAYVPVSLNFTGSLLPVAGEPLKFTCTPILGVGSQVDREEILLELDFASDPVSITARIKDKVSVPLSTYPDGCLSQVISAPRLSSTLPPACSSMVGRYVISMNAPASGGSADNNGYVLVQVLKTGSVLWATRLTGYSATGSASLNVANSNLPSIRFFETKYTTTSSLLNSSVLAGQMTFEKGDDLLWRAFFGSDEAPGCVERQTSCLAGGKTPVYMESLFNSGANYTSVKLLNFSEGDGCRWGGATTAALPGFLAGGKSMILSVKDPAVLSTGLNTVYSWNVSLSSNGVASAKGISNGGVLPPMLNLRLDRSTGQWTGTYFGPKMLRRNVFGASFTSDVDPFLLGRGWVECGTGVSLSNGPWALQLAP